jgi:hypothetical protein
MTTKRKIKRVANTILMFDLETVELGLILCHLEEFDWNRSQAARSLGISLRTLRNKLYALRYYGFDIPTSSFNKKDWSLEGETKNPPIKIQKESVSESKTDGSILQDSTTTQENETIGMDGK